MLFVLLTVVAADSCCACSRGEDMGSYLFLFSGADACSLECCQGVSEEYQSAEEHSASTCASHGTTTVTECRASEGLVGECPGCGPNVTPDQCELIHGCCSCCSDPNPCKTSEPEVESVEAAPAGACCACSRGEDMGSDLFLFSGADACSLECCKGVSDEYTSSEEHSASTCASHGTTKVTECRASEGLLGECPGCGPNVTPDQCELIHGCCSCCSDPNPCKASEPEVESVEAAPAGACCACSRGEDMGSDLFLFSGADACSLECCKGVSEEYQ